MQLQQRVKAHDAAIAEIMILRYFNPQSFISHNTATTNDETAHIPHEE